MVFGIVAASGLFVVANCSREDLYGDATFTDNVEAAYQDCDPNEITFLASKHNIQTAFDNCGSNKFAHISWSPDGRYLYFQLTHGGHILDGETKDIITLPTEVPIAGAAWMRNDLLVVPVGPSLEDPEGPDRLVFYNRAANTLHAVALDQTEPRDLASAGDGDRVYFTALDADGARTVYVADPATSEVSPALPFVPTPVERLVVEAEAGLLSWSDGRNSELVRLDGGEPVARFPDVLRVIPHPEGRYVALETLGEPISPFDQRSWNELSPEARERELARRDEWLQRLPDWAPREMRPPEIQIYDLSTQDRVRVTAFFGEHFEWYRPRAYFCSFIMWGIEGKQLHRNVGLTDLAERLRMASEGDIPMGLARVEPAAASEGEQPVQEDELSTTGSVDPDTPSVDPETTQP